MVLYYCISSCHPKFITPRKGNRFGKQYSMNIKINMNDPEGSIIFKILSYVDRLSHSVDGLLVLLFLIFPKDVYQRQAKVEENGGSEQMRQED